MRSLSPVPAARAAPGFALAAFLLLASGPSAWACDPDAVAGSCSSAGRTTVALPQDGSEDPSPCCPDGCDRCSLPCCSGSAFAKLLPAGDVRLSCDAAADLPALPVRSLSSRLAPRDLDPPPRA